MINRTRKKKPDTTVGLFFGSGSVGLAQMFLILDDRVVEGFEQRLAHF